MTRFAAIRRMLAIMLLALWWGGFSFYAGRVVFIGHQVLKNTIRQGFITERVTKELNWFGVAALAVVAWEMVVSKMSPHRKAIWIAWSATAIATIALFLLHIRLAGLLDFTARQVADDHFYAWHRLYLCIATVQWLAGSVLLATFHFSVCPMRINKTDAG